MRWTWKLHNGVRCIEIAINTKKQRVLSGRIGR